MMKKIKLIECINAFLILCSVLMLIQLISISKSTDMSDSIFHNQYALSFIISCIILLIYTLKSALNLIYIHELHYSSKSPLSVAKLKTHLFTHAAAGFALFFFLTRYLPIITSPIAPYKQLYLSISYYALMALFLKDTIYSLFHLPKEKNRLRSTPYSRVKANILSWKDNPRTKIMKATRASLAGQLFLFIPLSLAVTALAIIAFYQVFVLKHELSPFSHDLYIVLYMGLFIITNASLLLFNDLSYNRASFRRIICLNPTYHYASKGIILVAKWGLGLGIFTLIFFVWSGLVFIPALFIIFFQMIWTGAFLIYAILLTLTAIKRAKAEFIQYNIQKHPEKFTRKNIMREFYGIETLEKLTKEDILLVYEYWEKDHLEITENQHLSIITTDDTLDYVLEDKRLPIIKDEVVSRLEKLLNHSLDIRPKFHIYFHSNVLYPPEFTGMPVYIPDERSGSYTETQNGEKIWEGNYKFNPELLEKIDIPQRNL